MILRHAPAAASSMRTSILCSILCCWTLAVILTMAEEPAINLDHPTLEWTCPSSPTNSFSLTVVPPSRIFSLRFNDSTSRYCCPGEAVFIDEDGMCAESACILNGAAHQDFATCSVVDSAFQSYSDSPRYRARFSGFHSNDAALPNRNAKCCSPNSVCIKTTNWNHTEDIDTNYQLLQRMFTCMAVTDPNSGQLLDQPVPTEIGVIRVKNQPQRQEPTLATLKQDGTVAVKRENICPQGYYCPDSSTRFVCPDGKACKAGSSSPQPCPEDSICVRQMPTAKQWGMSVDKPSLQIPCSRLQRAVTCPANSAQPVPTPKGYYLDVSKNKLVQCKAGSVCVQGSTFLVGCARGYYCPDGVNEFKCPKGHECQVPTLASPIPCSAVRSHGCVPEVAEPIELLNVLISRNCLCCVCCGHSFLQGTYQPAEGEAGLWGFYNADKAPAKIRCQHRCAFGYQNGDADTKCEDIHPLVQVLFIAVTFVGAIIVYMLYVFLFRWIPHAREQLQIRKVDARRTREQAVSALNRKLVDRIVLDAMLLPISFETSRVVAAAGAISHSSIGESQVPASANSNIFILAQYRAFLHALLLDELTQPECPSIVRILVDLPSKFHLTDVAQQLSVAFKAKVLQQYHQFFTKYCEAQEKVLLDSDEAPSSRKTSNDQITVPVAVLEPLAGDIRVTLQVEFRGCIDSWIATQQAANNGVQLLSHVVNSRSTDPIGTAEYASFFAQAVLNKCKCSRCSRIRTAHWFNNRFSPVHTAEMDRSPSMRSDYFGHSQRD